MDITNLDVHTQNFEWMVLDQDYIHCLAAYSRAA